MWSVTEPARRLLTELEAGVGVAGLDWRWTGRLLPRLTAGLLPLFRLHRVAAWAARVWLAIGKALLAEADVQGAPPHLGTSMPLQKGWDGG